MTNVLAQPQPSVPTSAFPMAYFLPPAWIAYDDGHTCRIIDASRNEWFEVSGLLRMELFILPAQRRLLGLMDAQPGWSDLREALDRHAWVRLDRATLLRGSRYRQLYIELGARCNESCIHCYAESTPSRSETLAWNTIADVLHDAHALGFDTVQLTGGDPLISPWVVPAAERAKQLGFATVEVYTNGLALKGALYEKLRKLDLNFAFSFYSHDADTHDRITRTPGSHRQTLRAIQRVMADGLRFRIGIIATEISADHVPRTQAFLQELGVPADVIGSDGQREVGRSREFVPLQRVAKPTHRSAAATDSARAPATPRPFEGSAAVSYDGNVYPCIFSRHLPLGNLRSERLAEILTKSLAVSVTTRALHTFSQESSKLSCWECQLRSRLLSQSFDLRGSHD